MVSLAFAHGLPDASDCPIVLSYPTRYSKWTTVTFAHHSIFHPNRSYLEATKTSAILWIVSSGARRHPNTAVAVVFLRAASWAELRAQIGHRARIGQMG
jgi:hypothetical protein